MEVGRIAQIDNARDNYEIKAKQVANVDEKNKTINDEEYKKNSSKNLASELNEVILDNIQFGYNKKSRDFFVKVTRGEAEYKYPTEDMMKVKAFLLEELQKSNKID